MLHGGRAPSSAHRETTPDRLGACVLYLLAFPAVAVYLGALGLAVGIPITPWHLIPAFLCAGLVVQFVTKVGWRGLLMAGGFALCLSWGCAVLSGLVIDGTWDSNLYHYPATHALANGWNPVWMPKIQDFAGGWQIRGSLFIHGEWLPWGNVYPKALWYMAAPWTQMLNSAEAGNFSNLYYVIGSFLAIGWMLRQRLSCVDRWVVSVVAAMSPLAMAQLLTGYVDGVMGALLVLGVFSLWTFWYERDGRFLVVAALTFPIAANIKFTGAVYGGILVLFFAIPLWRSKAFWRFAGATFLLSALVGVNPYLTNTVRYGSPFYPILTLDAKREDVDVITSHMPEFLREMHPLWRFAMSHFVLDSNRGWDPKDLRSVWRKWANYKDHHEYWIDLRIGGFGPGFRLAFVLSLALALFVVRDRKLWFAGAVVMVSVLVNRHAWWARLVPQMAGIPPLLIAGVAMSRYGWARWFARVLAAILIANAVLIGMAPLGAQLRSTGKDLCRLINYADSGRRDGVVFSTDRSNNSLYASVSYRTEERLDVRVNPDPGSDARVKYRDFPVTMRAASRAREEELIGVEEFLAQIAESDAVLVAANEASIANGPIQQWLRARGCDLPADLDASKKQADMKGFACIIEKGRVSRLTMGDPGCLWDVQAVGHDVFLSAWPSADRHFIRIDGRYYCLGVQGANFVAVDTRRGRVHVAGFRSGEDLGPHWYLPLRPITIRDRLTMLFGCYVSAPGCGVPSGE